MAARAMVEKIFIDLSFPKSEERNMGSQQALIKHSTRISDTGGLKPALFTARVALCPLLNPKKQLGKRVEAVFRPWPRPSPSGLGCI